MTTSARYNPIRPGDVIGDRYEVRGIHAAFGVNQVFEGYDRQLGRLVDLMMVLGAGNGGERMETSFRRDLELFQRVRHPNIWQLYAYEPDERGGVLVAEHLSGHSLHKVIRDRKPHGFSTGEYRSIATQLSDALAAIHAASIVHADIKPGRVQVDGDRVVLRMFEFAEDVSVLAELPPGQGYGGTLAYASLERLHNALVPSMEDDIYLLGMTLLEAWTCRVPDVGKNPRQTPLREQVVIDPLAVITRDELRQIFRMLHENPAMRPKASDLRWGPSVRAEPNTAGEIEEERLFTSWVGGA